MPESKFALNKALKAARLYTNIDYENVPQFNVQQTMQDFENYRKSQGYRTKEEKQEELAKEMQAAQYRFNEQGLWNSEDPYEVYNAYVTDPRKQAEFRQQGVQTAGYLSTIPMTVFSAGTMGWVPASISTVTGFGGAYAGQKAGEAIDKRYGTNTTPWLSFAGGLFGGGLGAKGGMWAANQHTINKAFRTGQLRYGEPTSYTAYHQSSTPVTKFKFPFKERWDVRTHGADPNGAFFTVGEPAGAGFLSERPYTGQFHIKTQKPLIQTGEITGTTKNNLRNAIVKRARKDGADAVFFDGIADNQLQNQRILFAMDKADIGYRGMIGTPFKQGNWQLPKGVRNQILNGHLKGDAAIKMFNEYGGIAVPANSKIYSDIQKLVPEARERYGLVGRTDITDDQIAGSLYKRAMELNGEGNAAVWETGEPRLLFRGDTKRYKRLIERWSPEELAEKSGTMDNSLGNLFLGEISGRGQGVDRYFISGNDFNGTVMQGSSTGSRGVYGTIKAISGEGVQGTEIPIIPNDAYKLHTYNTYWGPYSVYKFPGKYSESGISDLNTFITRTPKVRDATFEISVLHDNNVMKNRGWKGPDFTKVDAPVDGIDGRRAFAQHYRKVLDEAKANGEGLLFSEPMTDAIEAKYGLHPFRGEHERYTYYALPNFNRQNAKHLFGWDLRKPVQWDVDNIYLEKGGKINPQQ